MEYGYCPFCGKDKIGYKKSGRIGDKKIEYFICFDCYKILYLPNVIEKGENI